MAITLDGTNGITTPDLAVDTNTLFVDAANNRVGVGTSSPAVTFSVSGDGPISRVTGSGGDFHGLQIQCADASGSVTKHAFIDIMNENGAVIANQLGVVMTDGGSFWSWSTQPSGARTDRRVERLKIDSTGNILIGQSVTSIPGLGNTTVGAAFEAVDGRALFISRGDGAALFLNANVNTQIASFRRSGNQVGDIAVSTTATSYNTSSDYRLKEDVQPIVGASDRVLSLKPVNFAWKVDGTRVDGFLAHEAQAVVPEAVHGTKDEVNADGNPVYQGIDQSKLVPLLTAALQEALQTIQALEARVAALETPA